MSVPIVAFGAFSATVFAESATLIGVSFTFVTFTVNDLSKIAPAASVVLTVTLRVAPAS